MKEVILYQSDLEKQTWVNEYQSRGWRMLHDDHMPKLPHQLTFTDEPAVKEVHWPTLWANAITLEAKLALIAKRLGYE